jgi:DNA-binding PadR family transcriptional regulator
MATLEEAGYVEVIKGCHGRRPRTWFTLTSSGWDAFAAYLAALSEIVGTVGPAARTRWAFAGRRNRLRISYAHRNRGKPDKGVGISDAKSRAGGHIRCEVTVRQPPRPP